MGRSFRTTAPGGAALLLLALVAGCSGGSQPSPPAEVQAGAGAGIRAQAPPGVPAATPATSAASAAPASPVPSGRVQAGADKPAAPAGVVQQRPTPPGQLHRHLLSFGTGAAPKQVAYTPDGREIWVTPLAGTSGVEVYEAATGRRTARVKLGNTGAVEVVFTRDGRTAYVSSMQTSSVYAIDTAAKRVRRQYRTGGSWTKVLALSPDERTVYAANWVSNDVSAIDLETGRVRRYPTVRTPRGLFVTPDGTRLYVAGYDNGEIERVDLATGAGKVLLRTGGAMRHLVGDPARGLVYADDMAQNRIYVLDPRTDRVRRLADTDENPNTIDLSPDGRVLYVSNRGRNGPNWYRPGPEWGSVIAIDTATGQHLDAIVGGNQTTGLDVSPDGTRLAFSDFLDDRLNVYEIPPYAVLAAGKGGRDSAHTADLAK